jgi:subfamily B ATP-binding cassette protein HlyB/CyaB
VHDNEALRGTSPSANGLDAAPEPLTRRPVREHSRRPEARDSGAECLAFLLRYLKLPADSEAMRREHAAHGGAMTGAEIVLAARARGVRCRAVKIDAGALEQTPLPAIATASNGRFFILAKVDDAQALVHEPGGAPKTIPRAELERNWTGELILLARRAQLAGEDRAFDLTWFIPVIVRYRRLFGEVMLASAFIQTFGLIAPLFFQVVIDKVLVHRGLTTLDVLVLGLIAVVTFEAALGYLRSYIFAHTTSRIDVELGAKLFRHLLGLPVAFFQARPVGQTVARVRELESVREFLTGSALTVVLDLFFAVIFLAVMVWLSPALTLVVLAAVPLYVGLSLFVTPILKRRIDERFRRGAANQAFLTESVSGIETLKAMAVEPQMRQRWEEQLAGYVRASFRVVTIGALASHGAQLVNKITLALLLWFGAQMVLEGSLSVGGLVAFNMLAVQVNQPILRLAQIWRDFQQFRLSVERLGDILNTPTEPSHAAARPNLPAVQGAILIDDVTFRYRSDAPEVLRGISLEIAPGEVVGIVGRSGSGKSTLTKLIQRLYVPERGRVLVDGVDLAMIDPAWLRRQIGVVLQENVLFNGSIRANIALADPSAGMDRVIAAASMAGAHEFILALPEGYDTEIGERGATLSGGQRQRIAIARALIADPPILIFDEATSALDYESERVIHDNMRRICEGRTVLIVAHRLSTVRHADRILTIEEGRVIENGAHDELVRRGGRYADLHRLQAGAG